MGGGQTVLSHVEPRLQANLTQHRVTVLYHARPWHLSKRVRARWHLTTAKAILHVGNRATWAPRAHQVVWVQNRFLLPGVDQGPYRTQWKFHVRKFLLRQALRVADDLVVPSRSMVPPTRQLMARTFLARQVTVHVIPHGRPDWLSPPERKLRDPIVLIYPTHHAWHKNFGLLPRLLRLLRQRAPERSFLLKLLAHSHETLGNDTLQDLFNDVSSSVEFQGQIPHEDMRRAYEEADIMIWPSLTESFGIPLLEGMTMGLPVVCSDTDWAREICADGAYYADPRRPEEWLNSIMEIARRGRRSNQAGLRRAQEFDWDKSAKKLAQILSDTQSSVNSLNLY